MTKENRFLPPLKVLRKALAETDAYALDNVRSGEGGPFAGSIHIYDIGARELIKVGQSGQNKVLLTGLSKAHAEDRVVSPENERTLEAALRSLKGRDLSVVFSSSAESCNSCLAKEEIFARRLTEQGLLPESRFFVTYGATYDDTARVALFNDDAYQRDMERGLPGTGVIPVSGSPAHKMPEDIGRLLKSVNGPAAAVVLPDGTTGLGLSRNTWDLTATAELEAICSASRKLKEEGESQPWSLKKGTLYTTTRDIGPMAYASALWANIGGIVTLDSARPDQQGLEAPGISNRDLFGVVARRPYNQPGSAVTVLHVPGVRNAAQHEWRRRIDKSGSTRRVYNGA